MRTFGRIRHVATRLPLAIEASAALGVASLGVRSRQASRLLGAAQAPHPRPTSRARPSTQAMRIGTAVERVAGLLPWHPACLPQAVAAAWMLRRRGIDCTAHLGVTTTKPLAAHAWVTVDGVVVQGGPVDQLTELGSFA